MVPILEKAIHVVQAVAAGRATGSMNQLARHLNIAPASCYRILQTLERVDWIRPRAGGGFELSAGLLGLVHPLKNVQRMLDLVTEPLTALTQESELAVKLSIRADHEAVTVFRVDSPRGLALASRVGAHFPLLIGSSGAVLCVDLDDDTVDRLIAEADPAVWNHQTPDQFRQRVAQARLERLCVDRGSFHPQVYTPSGPLWSAEGEVVAAVTLIGLPADLNERALPRLRRQLTQALKVCQQRLAGSVPTVDGAHVIGGAA